MSWLSRLFGGRTEEGPAAGPSAATEDYKGYAVTPAPRREGGQFRIAARIEKTVEGVTRRHDLLRADLVSSEEEATALSLAKAKQAIDQLGDSIFG